MRREDGQETGRGAEGRGEEERGEEETKKHMGKTMLLGQCIFEMHHKKADRRLIK